MAPWVSVLLLIVAFVLLDRYLVVQPGVLVTLPEAVGRTGERVEGIVVILPIDRKSGPQEEVAFFDDERFLLSDAAQRDRLRQSIRDWMKERSGSRILLQADQRVSQKGMLQVMRMVMEAGGRDIVLGTDMFE